MSRVISTTETDIFAPTGYTASNTSNTIGGNSGCTLSASTTYATLKSGKNTRYYTTYSFDCSSIPAGAVLNSVIIYGKAKVPGTGSSYIGSAATFSNETIKSNFVTINSIATNGGPFVVTGGTWTVSDIYTLKLSIYHPYGGNNRNLSFYGADAVINYTINGVEYEVSFNNQSSVAATEPSSTQYIFQGGNQSIKIKGISDINSIIVKDNDIDVTSNLVPTTNITTTLRPSSLINSNGTTQNTNNGLTGTDSSTYAQLRLQSNTYLLYAFDTSSIPNNATIISVSCQAKGCVTRTSNAATIQLYTGNTAKGSTTNLPINTNASIVDLTCGTWTRSELSDTRIRITSTYTNTGTYYAYFYGANLTINYTVNETYYTYTISNIQADHTIAISDALTSNKLYMKMDSMNTFITSAYSSNYDVNNLIAYVQNGAIVAGDTVLVSFTNLRRWYSGQGVSLGTFSFTFERTNTIGSWDYHYVSGDTGPGVRIRQLTAGSQLLIYPYDSRQTNAEYDGKIEVYKVTSVSGWVEMLGVFMKVNGVWVSQDISDELFYDNTVYMKN